MDCPHYHYRDGEYYCDLQQNTVSEAKHDNYCSDSYHGTNYDECDIYKRFGWLNL